MANKLLLIVLVFLIFVPVLASAEMCLLEKQRFEEVDISKLCIDGKEFVMTRNSNKLRVEPFSFSQVFDAGGAPTMFSAVPCSCEKETSNGR